MLRISVIVVIVGWAAANTLPPKVPPHSPTSKCYQCAYSKEDNVTETIQVPTVVDEVIEMTRVEVFDVPVTHIEFENVTFTKVVVEKIEVPTIVQFEVQTPKVVRFMEQISKIVQVLASEKDPKPISKLMFIPVEKSKMELETEIKTKTVIVHEEVSKLVQEIKEVSNLVTEIVQQSQIAIDLKNITKTILVDKNITKTTPGGWDKCIGPFTHKEAVELGVDTWDCSGNCYTRINGNNLYRGCYKGEFGVDPNLFGCNEQAGATWCICKGDLCNNGAKPNATDTESL